MFVDSGDFNGCMDKAGQDSRYPLNTIMLCRCRIPRSTAQSYESSESHVLAGPIWMVLKVQQQNGLGARRTTDESEYDVNSHFKLVPTSSVSL